ncbi:MAG TPA: hypothetical protein VMJ11_08405, partial [Paraburkholderia sp.]|uniref:hypothetical protein n=1 Tax=Paraburkholderia sp. TaxID=1926495 RepID=UPI002CB2AF02
GDDGAKMLFEREKGMYDPKHRPGCSAFVGWCESRLTITEEYRPISCPPHRTMLTLKFRKSPWTNAR